MTPTLIYSHWWPRAMRQGAITWNGVIYVAGPTISPGLLAHETVHLEQQAREGLWRFGRRYAWEYAANRLRGMGDREAYLAISYEVEARERSGVM